jgi:DMSO/TMAO reductase YedYZ heme-binding membrane subunit
MSVTARGVAEFLDRTERYRILPTTYRGLTGGEWLALAIAWLPPTFCAAIFAAYAAGVATAQHAQELALGVVEGPAVLVLALLLLCTPWGRLTGNNYRRRRKWFGLSFTFCAAANLLLFLLSHPFSDMRQAFAILGTMALVLCLPLAATSTRAAMRKLGGRRWLQLHRLVYAVAVAVIAHLWLVPQDDGPGANIVATVVFGAAAVLRMPPVVRWIASERRKKGGRSLLSARTWLSPSVGVR